MTGQTVSHYRIFEKLGEGGMGLVYRAEDIHLGRIVALKFLHNSADAPRLLREAKTAALLAHPNICSVYEVDPEHGFLAIELIEGEALKDVIGGRPLAVAEARRLAIQIGEGLASAHAKGIIHGDIKPANIMVTTLGQAKIMDFGLAHLEGKEQTIEGSGAGTPGYMAPEQWQGEQTEKRSDIWAFGAVLHEMLTGRKPSAQNETLPEGLGRIVRKALASNPGERYQHIEDLVVDLRRSTVSRPSIMKRFGRWIIASAAAVLLLGLYWWWSNIPYSPNPASLAWYTKGLHALHSATYESARKAMEQAVAADPGFALAHAGLAQAYEELDYSELAKESMLRAVTVNQERRLSARDQRRLQAFQLIVSRDYNRADLVLHKIESDALPADKPAAALECGWLAQRNEKTEQAIKDYERALKLDHTYAPAKLRLGQMLHRLRELGKAEAAFKEAEQLYMAASDSEGIAEALYSQASLLIRSNSASTALPVIERGLSVARTLNNISLQIRLQLLQGVAYRYLGDGARAAEIALRAIDVADAQHMDNLASSALVDLGNSFMTRRDVTSAEPIVHRALNVARRSKVRRHEARALLMLASICEQTGRPAEALKYIEAGVPFYREAGYRREVVQATMLLGGVYSQQAEFEKGIRVLRDVLPDAVQLHDATVEAQVRERLAEAQRDQGDWPAAIGETERAAKLLGLTDQSLDVRLNDTRLRWKLGRREEAARSLEEAEQLLKKYSNPVNLFLITVLKSEMALEDGQTAKAITLARLALAMKGTGADLRPRALVLLSAALLRGRQEKEALLLASSALTELDKNHRTLEAAQAHLSLAESLAETGQVELARDHALKALAFFEPHRIVEATWRANCVAARGAGQTESNQHRQAALSALANLKTLWPAADVQLYLARPHIKLLLQKL